jgi:tripartite-type tricarboxylate transporter receptor subunit TctC
VALARKTPGAVKYASGGVGSTSHFAVAMFVSVAGISKETLHLPYKGGGPSMVATMSNETQFYLGPIPGMVPQINAGKVKAIAITGDKRSPSLPDVPTLAELGLAGAESSGWFGPLAPAGTPAPIVERLYRAVVETTKDADVLKGLAAQGVEPATSQPAEFARYIDDTLARYRKVVAAENLKFE